VDSLEFLRHFILIGRDTPSSQITEGEEGPGGVLRGPAGEPRQPLDFPPPPPNKQSRSDIDDKFGKFEIKKLLEGIFFIVLCFQILMNCIEHNW
jgi:hypothetical protein